MEKIVKDYLAKMGYKDTINDTMVNNITTWLEWFQGKTKEHQYRVYNGANYIDCTLKSLSLPNQICNDKSDFIFNEKLDITIDNENINKVIRPILEQNNFLENANKLHQLVEALGTGAFVPYLDNGEVKINYNNATNIIPLVWDNDNIQDVLFWSKKRIDEGYEYYFNLHRVEEISENESEYVIYNTKIEVKKKNQVIIDLGDSAEIHTGSMIKKFGIDKTPEVNNFDINSPYGISTYANALDLILSSDRAYDTLDNEIKLGKKRVYINASASTFNTSPSGDTTPIFDPNDITFYQTPDEEGKEFIHESSFDLRIEELVKDLQTNLNLLSKKVGLGNNGLRFENGEVYTNTTNVMSSNSDVYRRLKKQENITTNAIRGLIYGIADLLGLGNDFSVSVFYDDSIIEDIKETRLQAQLELSNKLISKTQYYRDVYKLKDEEAKSFARQMADELKEETSLMPVEPEGEF